MTDQQQQNNGGNGGSVFRAVSGFSLRSRQQDSGSNSKFYTARSNAATERTPLLQGDSLEGADAQESGENVAEPRNPPPKAGNSDASMKALIPAIGSLWLVLFFAALDGTVVSTLLTPISSSFNASEKASWLGTAFLLSVCACTPQYGRLSDAVGRRNACLTALFFFTVGTLACSLAPSMNALLAARALAGCGAGGILTTSSIIMTDMVSLRQRGLFQGLGNIVRRRTITST